jgi:hypothetical protein
VVGQTLGGRGPEFPVTRPAGVMPVVCLGASTTEGSQDDDQTYPYHLQQDLVRCFPLSGSR